MGFSGLGGPTCRLSDIKSSGVVPFGMYLIVELNVSDSDAHNADCSLRKYCLYQIRAAETHFITKCLILGGYMLSYLRLMFFK